MISAASRSSGRQYGPGRYLQGGRVRVQTAAFAAVLAAIWHLASATELCNTYLAADCLFSTDPDRPVIYPQPLHPASFSLEQEAPCPFHGSGTFQRVQAERCDTPFMKISKHKLRRSQQPERCSSGSLTGAFKRQGERFFFEPRAEHNCSYVEYCRDEVGCSASSPTSSSPIDVKLPAVHASCLSAETPAGIFGLCRYWISCKASRWTFWWRATP